MRKDEADENARPPKAAAAEVMVAIRSLSDQGPQSATEAQVSGPQQSFRSPNKQDHSVSFFTIDGSDTGLPFLCS